MGTIKFEIDLPEFEKELSINVTVHRDGEVIYTTSSPSMGSTISNSLDSKSGGEQRKIEQEKIGSNNFAVDSKQIITATEEKKESTVQPKTTGKRRSGNLMNLDL